MKKWQIRHMLLIMILAFALILMGNAYAEESSPADKWEFDATVYMWGASIGGQSASGSDVDIDFNDLFSNLEMAFMGAFGAHKGNWSILTDVIYMNVKDEETIRGIAAGVELSGWIVTPAGAYTVAGGDWGNLDILAGARYLALDVDMRLGPFRADKSNDVWDGIIGVRGKVNFLEQCYLQYHLDVGTGDSDFTWQGILGIGYQLSRVDVVAGYRYLQWDFGDGKALDDLDFSGPYAGLKIRF